MRDETKRLLQEVYDTALKGLIAQGRPAYDQAVHTCSYRTRSGAKCAVGQLFTPMELDRIVRGGMATESFANLSYELRRLVERDSLMSRVSKALEGPDGTVVCRYFYTLQDRHDDAAIRCNETRVNPDWCEVYAGADPDSFQKDMEAYHDE